MVTRAIAILAICTAACVHPHGGAPLPRHEQRVEAIVELSDGLGPVDAFAVQRLSLVDWAGVTWVDLEEGSARLMRGFTADSSHKAPTLVIARRSPDQSRLSFSTLPLNPGLPRDWESAEPAYSAHRLPNWCEDKNWIALFFLGDRDTRQKSPVLIEFGSGDSRTRFRVEPSQSHIVGTPSIVLTSSELQTQSLAERLVITATATSRERNAFPLIVTQHATGGPNVAGSGSRSSSVIINNPTVWGAQVYFLADLPSWNVREGVENACNAEGTSLGSKRDSVPLS